MADTGTTAPTPGFLAATFRLCAGTKVLTEIYTTSPARAVFRFFLLTVLCAILASVVTSMVERPAFERAGKALDEEIGAFVVSPETITFEKNPDVPRRLKLPYLTLEYFPGTTFTRKDFNEDVADDFGFIVLPGGIASWSQLVWDGEDIFSSAILPADAVYAALGKGVDETASRKLMGSPWAFYSGKGLAEALKMQIGSPLPPKTDAKDAAKEAASEGDAADPAPVAITGSQLATGALSVLSAVVLLKTFVRNLLEIGLIVFLVSLIQYLRASTLPKGVVFRNVLTIMVYSTFPAQIFATLFDAAGGGRFISFQLLFVCIFFFYQLFAFRAILRKINPQLGKNDRDSFDDDF